eukprot:CAMPEP_0204286194 /NCGR_PEP_ID=MMETSP0468-20130131/52276_1 /ASSEMBLY_ACC=CAM_ASM_000383 /TAXON_ID=2969 /ORGANISM="Oxyrrhis marina" /LENGTH=222 /DNA_ID=CAMNT_0051264091 /DNA_START=18 /DNA_END=683 /DNA_ORIENTATION=+
MIVPDTLQVVGDLVNHIGRYFDTPQMPLALSIDGFILPLAQPIEGLIKEDDVLTVQPATGMKRLSSASHMLALTGRPSKAAKVEESSSSGESDEEPQPAKAKAAPARQSAPAAPIQPEPVAASARRVTVASATGFAAPPRPAAKRQAQTLGVADAPTPRQEAPAEVPSRPTGGTPAKRPEAEDAPRAGSAKEVEGAPRAGSGKDKGKGKAGGQAKGDKGKQQ